MIPYVVCRCGNSLGDLYDFYQAIRKYKISKYCADKNLKIAPDMLKCYSDYNISGEEEIKGQSNSGFFYLVKR